MSEVCEENSEGEQFARLSVFASLKKNHKKNLPNLRKISLIKLWLFKKKDKKKTKQRQL